MTLAWILGIVGTLGIAGTVALVFFAPAVGLLIWQAVTKITVGVLSTRLGCAAVALAGGLIAGDLYGDLHGRSQERAACHEAEIRAQLQATLADLAAANLAALKARAAMTEIEKNAGDRDEKLRKLEADLGKMPAAGRCRLDESMRRRLLDIRHN